MRSFLVIALLALVLTGLLLQQTVGVAKGPLVSSPGVPTNPSSSTAPTDSSRSTSTRPPAGTLPGPVPFHVIMFAYANGGIGFGRALTAANYSLYNSVPEINDEQTWERFWYNNLIACDWPPTTYCPPIPQVDFTSRTVLLVSTGSSTWDVHLNLTKIVSNAKDLQLDGQKILIGKGCVWIALVVTPVLLVDVPKTQLPAEFLASPVTPPSCLDP